MNGSEDYSTKVTIGMLAAVLAIPTFGLGAVVNGFQGVFGETGDDPAAVAVYDMAAAIEAEKKASPENMDKPLEEFDAISALPKDWFEGAYQEGEFRQYFISKGSTPEDYCVMVKQSYGKEAKNGIIYSSTSDFINTREKSDCGREDFDQVAGPKQEIEPYEFNALSVIWPYTIIPGGATLLLGGTRVMEKRDERRAALEERKKLTLAAGGPPPKSYPPEFRASLQKRVEDVIGKWVEYETDPVKVIDYPMVTNMSFEPTSNFHLALLQAKTASSDKSYDLGRFEEVVFALEHAFTVMISEAQRMKWSSFSEEEQKHLSKAQTLLQMALNSSSSAHERNVAYKRLLKEVEGILSLSTVTTMAIEARTKLQLTDQTV